MADVTAAVVVNYVLVEGKGDGKMVERGMCGAVGLK